MSPPINIDGTDITGGTIDGTDFSEVTVDGTTVFSAIPDSGLDHLYYAKSVNSIDPWADEEGGADISSVGDPSLDSNGINGFNSVVYDGVDDYHAGTGHVGLGSGDEWTAVVVVEVASVDDQSVITVGNKNTGYNVQVESNGYAVNHGGSDITRGGSSTTDPQVVVATYDGSTAILDANKTQQINTSLGSPNTPTDDIEVGARLDGGGGVDNHTDGDVGAAGHEAAFADATRRDNLTDLFADEFNITV